MHIIKRILSSLLLIVMAASSAAVLHGCTVIHAEETKFENEINYETLSYYAATNAARAELFSEPIKGIVIQFHSIGDTSTGGDQLTITQCNRNKYLYIFPYSGPWNWMNKSTVRLADRLIDVLIEKFGLDKNIPVISTGGSMGGQCALVFPVYSTHNVVAAAADSPVCDLDAQGKYDTSFLRTYVHAVGDYSGSYTDAIASVSPVKLIDKMPDIPYFIVHGQADTSVPDNINSDVLVAAMLDAGLDVTYYNPETMTHVAMPSEIRNLWFSFIFSAVSDS